MKISQIEATDLFLGPAAAPRQVVRVTLTAGPASPPGPGTRRGPHRPTPEPAVTGALAAGEQRVVEVGVLVAAPATEGPRTGSPRSPTTADRPGHAPTASVRAAATGWTMWMVSHFHYDPVWWNTQRGFTEPWHDLPDAPGADRLRPQFVRTAFDLVRAHLDAARRDDGLPVRARRGRLPQAVLGRLPRGPRRPAPAARARAGSSSSAAPTTSPTPT